MKNTVHRLRIGDQIWVQVMENLSADESIVSFQGDLVRVRNESLSQLKCNEKILVRVVAISPLSLQIINDNKNRAANRIDVSV